MVKVLEPLKWVFRNDSGHLRHVVVEFVQFTDFTIDGVLEF